MKPSPPKGRHILVGTIQVTLGEGLILPTALVTTAFLTRRLGPEGYGLLVLATMVVVCIEALIASLLEHSTVKFVGQASDWQPLAAAISQLFLWTSLAATVLLWLLAGPVAAILGEPLLAKYLKLISLELPVFGLAQAHRNVLIGLGAFKERALASAGRWLSRMVFVILLVALGFSIEGAIWGSIGGCLVELVIERCYIQPSLWPSSKLPLTGIWSYALPLFFSGLAMQLFLKTDLFLLKALGGSAAVAGYYGAAQNLSLVPCILALALSPLLLSTLSRMLRDDQAAEARAMSGKSLHAVAALLPLVALTAASADEIVVLVYGDTFLSSGPLLAVLVLSGLFLVLISVATAILTAAGRPLFSVWLTGPLVPLAALGHVLIIPRFGALGATWVTTTLAGFGAAAGVLAVYRTWKTGLAAYTLLRSLFLSVTLYFLASLWPTPGFLVLLKLAIASLLLLMAYVLLGELELSALGKFFLLLRSSGRPQTDVQVAKEEP